MLNLASICLGVLYSGSKTGYEIHKIINKDLKHFQTASYGALYPALGKLEAKALITSKSKTVQAQQQSLLKKKYTITEEGCLKFQAVIKETKAKEIASKKSYPRRGSGRKRAKQISFHSITIQQSRLPTTVRRFGQ